MAYGMDTGKGEPVVRSGAASFVHCDHFYVCQGRRQWHPGPKVDRLLPLQRYDFSSAQWSGVSPVCVDPEPEEKDYWREITCDDRRVGVCCAVLGDCAYMFGGLFWKYGFAVHELNLKTVVWRRLEAKKREDGPMHKDDAGMVTCGDEALCVFGGCGRDTGRHQLGATYHTPTSYSLTNELHLFHLRTSTWSSPETTGPWPPPCAGFSFTKVDLSRVVMFGGEQRRYGPYVGGDSHVDELHILDVDTWHWSGAILHSIPWPTERSLHSACVLFDPIPSSKERLHSQSPHMGSGQHSPQLFVLWGIKYTNYKQMSCRDAWILDVNNIKWKQVKLPPVVGSPRMEACLGCYNCSPMEAELVVFGGWRYDDVTSRPFGSTTLLYLGMKSLYHSCVDCVAERYELYQSLLQQLLPPHVQNDICREREKRDSRAHY